MSTLTDNARNWLNESGFRFEASVAEAFRSHGFDVYQGLHYSPDRDDAIGGREVDVIAVRDRITGKRPLSRGTIAFVLECKSRSAPWIAASGVSAHVPWGAADSLPITGMLPDQLVSVGEPDEDPWLLRLPAMVGFRVLAMLKQDGAGPRKEHAQGREPTFDAIRQAVSAAQGVVAQGPSHIPMAVVPVVVTDGPLLRASLHGRDEPEVVPTPFERVLWRGDISGKAWVVDVVAGEAIHDYCHLAQSGADEGLAILRRVSIEKRRQALEAVVPGRFERALAPMIAVGDAVAGLLDRPTRQSGD